MKKKNKKYFFIIFISLLVLILCLFLFLTNHKNLFVKEKESFQDENNNYSLEKQKAISCALQIYDENKMEGVNFSSQCLGDCYDYVVDIVHNPRLEEDNLKENQCPDYLSGKLKHFIELDEEGKLIRII
jgi:hypothetical protein